MRSFSDPRTNASLNRMLSPPNAKVMMGLGNELTLLFNL
jgi:hypothetical protein